MLPRPLRRISVHNLSLRLRPLSPRTAHHAYSRPITSLPLLSSLPTPLVPPLVFVGLALSLWAYKCAMMVIFQNRIIYMPSMPPFSRSETIEDYKGQCGGVRWEEKRVRSGDGVEVAVCVGSVPRKGETETGRHVVVLYFQGNGSSTPPRLPLLSSVLTRLSRTDTKYTIAALSYRGYWTSRGRPSQRGIELDAVAALQYVHSVYPQKNTAYVLWGQSIGAGVATGLVARHAEGGIATTEAKGVQGMILETPFLSVKSMLLAMYPQKWLPYRYLWPFLRSWWDSEDAVRRIGGSKHEKATATSTSTTTTTTRRRTHSLPILILSAEHDELVPPGQAEVLEKLCHEVGISDVEHVIVSGALHNDASARGEGMGAIVRFLKRVGQGDV